MRFQRRTGNALVLLSLLTIFPGVTEFAQTASDRTALDEVRAQYEAKSWTRAAQLAASAQPRSADLELYLGLSLAQLGKLDEARNAFLTGYRSYPRDGRFAEELAGIAYREKNRREAKRWLEQALARNAGSTYANDFMGLLYLADGNLPAALKYWNRIGRPLIQDVRFDPVPTLNPLLLDRAMAASSGQILSADRLQMTQSNLDRLGIFNGSRFDLTPRQDRQFDFTVRTAGDLGNPAGWVGRVLPYLRGLPYETVFFDLPNLGHGGATLSSLVRWDSNKRRAALSLAGPVRLNPRWTYELGIDARDEIWDLTTTYFARPGGLNGLNLRKIEAGGGFEYGLTSRLSWTTGLWVAKRDFRNRDQESIFANGWSAQFRNGLKYLLWNWPEQRVRVDASAQLDTGRIFTTAPGREIIARGALSASWLPKARGDDLALKLHLDGGRIFGTAPFDDYFMLGMERDNDPDLWLRGHVGTRDGRKGSAPMGTRYLLLQTELDRTVFKLPFVRVQLGPFLDVGRIADSTGAFGSNGFLADPGVQAKVETAGSFTWSLVYGRDLRDGRGVFYTSVTKSRRAQ